MAIARFSTVAGERGAADAERDGLGPALKFDNEDGGWDFVGENSGRRNRYRSIRNNSKTIA